MNESVEEY